LLQPNRAPPSDLSVGKRTNDGGHDERARMKAKTCFDNALDSDNPTDRVAWQSTGQEFAELAIALEAATSRDGADHPDATSADDKKDSRKL
jgi:hypothetical protein